MKCNNSLDENRLPKVMFCIRCLFNCKFEEKEASLSIAVYKGDSLCKEHLEMTINNK